MRRIVFLLSIVLSDVSPGGSHGDALNCFSKHGCLCFYWYRFSYPGLRYAEMVASGATIKLRHSRINPLLPAGPAARVTRTSDAQ
jgi:hypothetical protein